MSNFREIAAMILASGGGDSGGRRSGAYPYTQELLTDSDRRIAMGRRGIELLERKQGCDHEAHGDHAGLVNTSR